MDELTKDWKLMNQLAYDIKIDGEELKLKKKDDAPQTFDDGLLY